MILNLTDAKLILQISGSDLDNAINAILPGLNQWVLDYCGFPFDETSITYTATTIAFNESAGTITDTASGFGSFGNDTDIRVWGSDDNSRIFSITTAAAGTLTLDTGWSVIEESAGQSVKITRIRWKDGLKNAVAMCLGELLQPSKISGVDSESLADWSVKYTTGLSESAFSATAIGYLRQYRTVRWLR
jgi:hypothetical protein